MELLPKMSEFLALQIFLVYLSSAISYLHEISIFFYGKIAEKVAFDLHKKMYPFLISPVPCFHYVSIQYGLEKLIR